MKEVVVKRDIFCSSVIEIIGVLIVMCYYACEVKIKGHS